MGAVIESGGKYSLCDNMNITFNTTFLVVGMGKVRSISLTDTRNHRFATTGAAICMLLLMLPFNTLYVDKIVILV